MVKFSWNLYFSNFVLRFWKVELQNRVTCCDVILPVSNSKTLKVFIFSELLTRIYLKNETWLRFFLTRFCNVVNVNVTQFFRPSFALWKIFVQNYILLLLCITLTGVCLFLCSFYSGFFMNIVIHWPVTSSKLPTVLYKLIIDS